MRFFEQPPSKQWASLQFGGETIAEVWFKPEEDPFAVLFRIPRNSFDIPGVATQLTTENLLKAVAIAPGEVESWGYSGISRSGLSLSDLQNPLSPPGHDVSHLGIYVRVMPLAHEAISNKGSDSEEALAKWQEVEARWKAILNLEATIDTLRISMEGLWAEMEGAIKRGLTPEERLHALAADMAQLQKAKSRVHYTTPKAKDFIHRATWAKGAPERKRLDEFFKSATGATTAIAEMNQVLEEIDVLRKNLQIFSGLGVAVANECKTVCAEVQQALRRLQSNSTARAAQKRNEARLRGKTRGKSK